MADNVAITAGSGTAVSTEEVTTLNGGVVSARHLQRIAAAIVTADSTAVDLPGDSTNGLDVDVTRVIPGTSATHLGKAEDAAHTSGDTGVMLLAVRKDTAAALAGTDADYIPLIVDANGRLHIAPLVAGSAIIGKVGIDQTTPGTTDSVTPKATEAHLGEVGGNLIMISTEFTRPSDTTAYTAGDAVSNDTTTTTMQALANAARVSGGSGYITGIRVTTDKKSITPRIRVHFWNTNGATVAGDNLAFKSVYADISKRVGSWDMPAMATPADSTNSDQSTAIDMTVRLPYTCAATSLYYTLETLDAFTPASAEKITVTVFADRN